MAPPAVDAPAATTPVELGAAAAQLAADSKKWGEVARRIQLGLD
jgi:hypothetical protein